MEQNIYEVMNDFEKIMEIAQKHADPSHSKFIKKEYKYLEESYRYYNRKYQLPYCPFENNLNGLCVGDKFEFTLTPEQAYGEYNDEHLIDLPKNMFEVDGKFDTDIVYEGNIVPMLDTNGNRLNGVVVSIGDDSVKMDFNHPLAGETLHFSGEVLEVRDATAEEIAALTSHSCGCGCSGCNSEGGGCSEGCGSGCGK